MVSELIGKFLPKVCDESNHRQLIVSQSAFRFVSAESSDDMTRQIAASNAAVEKELLTAWKSLHNIPPQDCARFVMLLFVLFTLKDVS